MCSSAFGIFTTGVYVISGLFYNTLTDHYNLKLFKINIIIPLSEKREIFKQEFVRILEQNYLNNHALYTHLKQEIADTNFVFYDEKLQTIKERLEIKSYANDIMEKSVNNFLHVTHQASIDYLISFTGYAKLAAYGLALLVVLLGVIAIVRYFCSDDKLLDVAQTSLTAAQASLESAKNNLNTHQNMQEFAKQVPDMIASISTAAVNIKDTYLTEALNKIIDTLKQYDEMFKAHARVISENKYDISVIHASIAPLLKPLTVET